MLIICEGGDGTGKSTLVADIAAALRAAHPGDRVEVRHVGPPPPGTHPIDAYAEPLYDYRPGSGHHIVCDRWHVGEWVYPDLLGRASRADEPTWRWLNLVLAARGAVLVHCDRSPADAAAAVAARGDDLVSPDQTRAAVLAFRDRVAAAGLPTHLHDVGYPELAVFTAASVVTSARVLEARAAELHRFITYAGPLRPRYLLLGDVRHALGRLHPDEREPRLADRESTRELGPAFGPYRGTSGHFLLGNLPAELLRAGGLGLANACDVDDVAELHAELGHPPTVALGTNAWKAAVRANLAVGGVPHPQFVRRFFNSHGKAYGRIIEQALVEGRNLLSWRPSGTWLDPSRSTT